MLKCPNCGEEFGGIPEARSGPDPWPDPVSQLPQCGAESCSAQFRFDEYTEEESTNRPVMFMTLQGEEGERTFVPEEYEWKVAGDGQGFRQ